MTEEEKRVEGTNQQTNEDLVQKTMDMARMMNYRMHAQNLFVPVLKDFEVKENNNPQMILLATGYGFIEQLVSDGYIGENEFEQRIELVINNTKEAMKRMGVQNSDTSFIYYKDYSNETFDFKLYVQDLIFQVENETKVTRNIIAFFVEPKLHDFYQFSLGAGPFTMPTEQLKVGTIDLENDQLTATLDNLTNFILDNLKYRSEMETNNEE